jgi:hypothetical protein
MSCGDGDRDLGIGLAAGSKEKRRGGDMEIYCWVIVLQLNLQRDGLPWFVTGGDGWLGDCDAVD